MYYTGGVNDREADKIERLKQKLYTPEEQLTAVRRSALSPLAEAGSGVWTARPAGFARPKKRTSALIIVFFVSLAFFLAALGAAVYVFYRGGNLVSPANVELLIDGPPTIKAGETLTFQVLVANRNSAALESVDLIVEYPAGTREPRDLTKPLPRNRWSLEAVNPGATANQTIRAVVFGEKDTEQEIRVTIEYRLANSNAIFDKIETYHYYINDSPVSLTADWPAEVNAGQTLTLTFEIMNNAAAPLKDLVIKGDYPPGFIFQSASPPTVAGDFWRIGDLAVGGRRRFAVTGVLEGQHEDQKSFRFSAGTAKSGAAGEIDLVYGELFKIVTIKRPSVGLTLVLNGEPASGEQTASSGELLRADITWINNLPTEVLDGRIEVRIKGEILDERSVTVADGFWQSTDNLIIWHRGIKPALARLAVGSSGQVSFTFSTEPLFGSSRQLIENPSLELEVRFIGRRIAEGLSDEPLETKVTSLVKINSVFQLAATAFYHDGPFANSGPLPPKVGEETTYTIIWSVINSSNIVRDAAIKATLPTYVRWLGFVSPASENVTFNESTGEVVWNLGVVEAGRGLSTAAREVAFQIAFRPSASQVEQAPVILAAPALTGTDTFTGEILTYTRRALDTRLLNDSQFRPGDERVVSQ